MTSLTLVLLFVICLIFLLINTVFIAFISCSMWLWSFWYTFSKQLLLPAGIILVFTCSYSSFLAFQLMSIPFVCFSLFIYSTLLMTIVIYNWRCCYYMVRVCDWLIICVVDVQSNLVSSICVYQNCRFLLVMDGLPFSFKSYFSSRGMSNIRFLLLDSLLTVSTDVLYFDIVDDDACQGRHKSCAHCSMSYWSIVTITCVSFRVSY